MGKQQNTAPQSQESDKGFPIQLIILGIGILVGLGILVLELAGVFN